MYIRKIINENHAFVQYMSVLVCIFYMDTWPILADGYGEKVLNIMRALGRAEQGIFDINQIEFPLTG